jgi:hypothetical protein
MATGMSMRVMLIRELAASVHMGVIKGKMWQSNSGVEVL